jgi:hypothetical protein
MKINLLEARPINNDKSDNSAMTSKKLMLQLGVIDCKGATSMMLLTWWGTDQYSKPQAPTWSSPLKV